MAIGGSRVTCVEWIAKTEASCIGSRLVVVTFHGSESSICSMGESFLCDSEARTEDDEPSEGWGGDADHTGM